MMENGKMTTEMAKEHKFGQMDQNIKDNGKIAIGMAQEH